MNDMITFCDAILKSVVQFLATPPVFYLFALICFASIIGIVRSLLRSHY